MRASSSSLRLQLEILLMRTGYWPPLAVAALAAVVLLWGLVLPGLQI